MDADWIITVFVLIDTLMERVGHQSAVRAQVPDSEVILIAVAAAKYFHNHHERAVCILRESCYLSGRIDVTRFNRRFISLPTGWSSSRARGARFSARVRSLSSIACPCQSVGGYAHGAVKRCADAPIAATVPPKKSSSSAGGCT